MPRTALLLASTFAFGGLLTGCPKDEKSGSEPPPPPPPAASVAKAGACEKPGTVTDSVSAAFFSGRVADYCVDPNGEVKTYGEKGKLSMDEVCTTAVDGECEVYKRYGLKRLVSMHYVDGTGKGGNVEVNLSRFADPVGAYGMFTMRVVAGDPAEPSTPKPLAAGGAGAIGTGRAYVWRGEYLAELQYVNEQESPTELAKSSNVVLTAIGKDLGDHLPGATTLPPSAAALPTANRIPNGIVLVPKEVAGFGNVGPVAYGYYRDGDRRWRVLASVKDDPEQAKDAFKAMKAKPGTLPVPQVGDEAANVVVATNKETKGPKVEFLIARSGKAIWGVGDEEYALRAAGDGEKEAKARLTKDEAIAKIKPLIATAPAAATSSSASPSTTSPPKK